MSEDTSAAHSYDHAHGTRKHAGTAYAGHIHYHCHLDSPAAGPALNGACAPAPTPAPTVGGEGVASRAIACIAREIDSELSTNCDAHGLLPLSAPPTLAAKFGRLSSQGWVADTAQQDTHRSEFSPRHHDLEGGQRNTARYYLFK